jgi:nucleotide-binding universal stress UspA family protein
MGLGRHFEAAHDGMGEQLPGGVDLGRVIEATGLLLERAMYKHILIATDGSELAGKAVATGLALAKRLDAKVTAITAIEPWLSIASSDTAAAFMQYQRAAEEEAGHILGQISTSAREQGTECETVTVTETAAEAIIETAKNKKCDLIVMSSHGRRGLARVLLGSQAMRVLTLSSVPVLVCR